MAPTTVGTNCLTRTEDALVQLLANTPGVQAFLSATDGASASQRIYLHDVPQAIGRDAWSAVEFAALFPCIVIAGPTDGEIFSVDGSARDAGLSFDVETKFSIRFEAYPATGLTDEQEVVRVFLNAVFGGIEGMIDRINAGTGEYQATRLAVENGLYRGRYDGYERLGDALGIKLHIENTVS